MFRVFLSALALVIVVLEPLEPLESQELQFAEMGECALESGEVIRDCLGPHEPTARQDQTLTKKPLHWSGLCGFLPGKSVSPVLVIQDRKPLSSVGRAGRIGHQLTIGSLPVQGLGPFTPQEHPTGTILFPTLALSARESSPHKPLGRPPLYVSRGQSPGIPVFHAHVQICTEAHPKPIVSSPTVTTP